MLKEELIYLVVMELPADRILGFKLPQEGKDTVGLKIRSRPSESLFAFILFVCYVIN